MENDGGWSYSARAYIEFQDRGDVNRTLLLDPVMLRLCGDVTGARVLDVGCGEGRFCRMLGERGASTVGIDPIAELARTAREREMHGGSYVLSRAEEVPFSDATFDLVVSYITLVDIPGFREAIAEMARVLRPGGHLVVANLSFVTASDPWIKDAEGKRLYRPIDRYAEEWRRTFEWVGIRIENWHRPLANYMQAYLSNSLILRDFLEPVPEDQSFRQHQAFEDWFRVPEFTVMRWERA